MKEKIYKYLLIGLIASIITVVLGELPIGWYIKPNVNDVLQAQLDGYATLSIWQLAIGILFGSIGIAFQSFGYKAISIVIKDEAKDERASKFVYLGAIFCAMFGPIVHVLVIILMYLSRFLEIDDILQFALYFVLPISLLFMTVYLIMMVFIFLVVIKNKTSLPKWFAFINPIILIAFIDIITTLIGNHYVSNSIHMADMGLASMITFSFWIIHYRTKITWRKDRKGKKKIFDPFKIGQKPYRLGKY